MKIVLHVVTRYTRENSRSLANCFNSFSADQGSLTDVKWFLVGKGVHRLSVGRPDFPYKIESAVCPVGDYGLLLNLYLDCVRDEGQWVYFLDADNLLHPRLVSILRRSVNQEMAMIVVSQQFAAREVRHAAPENLVVQGVDIGQVCFNRTHIGDLRFWSPYRNDGYFIQEMAIRARECGKIVMCIDEVASFYNRQLW